MSYTFGVIPTEVVDLVKSEDEGDCMLCDPDDSSNNSVHTTERVPSVSNGW